MPPGERFAFGPFQLDAKTRRLFRDGEPVALAPRQFDLLHLLVSRAGQILSKDLLIETAWQGVAVTDNSLEQAISSLRRMLTPPVGQQYIETEARRGYRFVADVTRLDRRETNATLDALLAPHRAWVEGRAALETLGRDQILRARAVLEGVMDEVPQEASAHVGLANACVLEFEMTRSDASPDSAALAKALHHAYEACRLDSSYGEAWATLGFVLDRTGRRADALAASRRAVALEPDNWRHHLRLSYGSWGEERLREARRTLALLPAFPLAHWLAASVYVARQALAEAERELVAGIATQRRQAEGQSRFSGVALHWLLGLICLARGDEPRARDEFEQELSREARGHLYARECCANTWYAIGALERTRGRPVDAVIAFRKATERVPAHPMAQVGLDALGAAHSAHSPPARDSLADAAPTPAADGSRLVDVAMLRAAQLVLVGQSAHAARVMDEALGSAGEGNSGWLLPIEPTLRAYGDPELWAPALARLSLRAA